MAWILLLVASGALQTGAAADRKIPLPKLKPSRVVAIPTPRLKPELAPVTVPAPEKVVFPPITASSEWPKDAIAAERKECEQRLNGLDIIY